MFWQEKDPGAKIGQPAPVKADFWQGKVPVSLWGYNAKRSKKAAIQSIWIFNWRLVNDPDNILSLDSEKDNERTNVEKEANNIVWGIYKMNRLIFYSKSVKFRVVID